MDRPQPVSAELTSDLRNLRALNRYFGSYRLVRHFLQRWIRPNETLRVLDLATGSGDIPRVVVEHARKVGANVTIDAVDFQASTVEIARSLSVEFPEIQYHCADIHQFGEEGAYDLVLFSLALHHFSEENAITLLRRCRQLGRRHVLVADLRRSWFAKLSVAVLTTFVFREAMTRNDARVSVERSFSVREFDALAQKAGWTGYQHRRFRFARQAIWLEAPDLVAGDAAPCRRFALRSAALDTSPPSASREDAGDSVPGYNAVLIDSARYGGTILSQR